MANSKAKGSRFERVVAKYFTEWTSYNFGRSPQSGSFHNNRDLGSDLICNDDHHKRRCCISIECKNYQDIRFEHILLGNKRCKILAFWDQASRDAKRTKKLPILCMRYNSMPKGEFFFVVDPFIASSILKLQKPDGPISKLMVINNPDLLKLSIPTPSLYVFMASEIKEKISYKALHKLLRKTQKEYYQ